MYKIIIKLISDNTIICLRVLMTFVCQLTCPIKFREGLPFSQSVFLLPAIISRSKTPKLNTSDFVEYRPSIAYSGDIYPLHNAKRLEHYKLHTNNASLHVYVNATPTMFQPLFSSLLGFDLLQIF